MAIRKFDFPLSVLLGSNRRLHDALTDPDYTAATSARLDDATDMPTNNFTTRFKLKRDAIGAGESSQKLKTGEVGSLTQDQHTDFEELGRLVAGVRRNAQLAFPGDHVKQHSDFQVGIDEPKTLDAKLERAGIILAPCRVAANAAALRVEGWLPTDSNALEVAISTLSDTNLDKEEAFDDRLGLTQQKIAANAVYTDVLRIQNAARLQYPAHKSDTATARARFLLGTFPPRDRSEHPGDTQASTTPVATTGASPTS